MPEYEAEKEFLEGVCLQCQSALLDSLHEKAHCGHCDCCSDEDGEEYEQDTEVADE